MKNFWPRFILFIMGVLFIFAVVYAYKGIDVPPLYKSGRSVREGSYRHSHYSSGGFYYFGGGGYHSGK
jgi:hypothetical protein